mgnify:CR=1 FL=1
MSRKLKGVLRQIGIQLFLLLVTVVVLFPILWVVSLALDPRDIDKPLELRLIPPGASLDSFRKVLFEPFNLLCRDPNNPATCMKIGRAHV